jgi:hypothetical protein
MSIGRSIIIPVILALTTTGSILAGAASPASAAQASAGYAHSITIHTSPDIRYHC